MGNSKSCLGKTSKKSQRNNSTASSHKVRPVADALCAELHLRRTPDSGRFIRRNEKWMFGAEQVKTCEPARLELFLQNSGLNWKWLIGEHFMPFDSYWIRQDYHCFVYMTLGNVREYVSRQHLGFGSPREGIIIGFLPDILNGLRDLGRLGLYHTSLSWDAVEIDTCKRARIGSLEYVIERKKAINMDMADVRHLPPEVLKTSRDKNRDLEKVETWIFGSLILEILLHNYISGNEFVLYKQKPQRSQALQNIKANAPKLALILDASSLSKQTQSLIKGMLCEDINSRMNLNQALAHFGLKLEDPSCPCSGGRGSVGSGQKDIAGTSRSAAGSSDASGRPGTTSSAARKFTSTYQTGAYEPDGRNAELRCDIAAAKESIVIQRGLNILRAVMKEFPEEHDYRETSSKGQDPSVHQDEKSYLDGQCYVNKGVRIKQRIQTETEDISEELVDETMIVATTSEPVDEPASEYPLVTEPSDYEEAVEPESNEKPVHLVMEGQEPLKVLISILLHPGQKTEYDGRQQSFIHAIQSGSSECITYVNKEAILKVHWSQLSDDAQLQQVRPVCEEEPDVPPSSAGSEQKSTATKDDKSTIESSSDMYRPPKSAYAPSTAGSKRSDGAKSICRKGTVGQKETNVCKRPQPSPTTTPPRNYRQQSPISRSSSLSSRGSQKDDDKSVFTGSTPGTPTLNVKGARPLSESPRPQQHPEDEQCAAASLWRYEEMGAVAMQK